MGEIFSSMVIGPVCLRFKKNDFFKKKSRDFFEEILKKI
jgi:hypothetical protein